MFIKRIRENFNRKITSKLILGKKIEVKPARREISKKLVKTLRRVVKTNLLSLINKDNLTSPPQKDLSHKGLIEMRSVKIKDEFHCPSAEKVNESLNNKENTSPSSTNIRCIEFSSFSESSPNQNLSLRQQLMAFATKHKPKPEMFEDLLNLMKVNGLRIPRSPDTLFDKKFEVLNLTFGNLLNIGVERAIRNYYRPSYIRRPMALVTSSDDHFQPSQPPDTLLLDIAVYMTKSKEINGLQVPQCLTIFGRINCEVFDEPFVIGIYYGTFPTPTIANEILKPFVDEMKSLETRELVVEGNQAFIVKIHSFLCDPISSSLITCTALPDALHGCSKCNQKTNLDVENGNRSNYPMHKRLPSLRYDDDFKFLLDTEHHVGVPILTQLDLGLVSQFALDYKIIVCQGVMKNLMNIWINGGKLDYRLNKDTKMKINRDLQAMALSSPREMSRRQLSVDDLSKWTAKDWSEFLLYYSPIALKSRMSQRYYVHFLYLHLAMRILMTTDGLNCESNSFILGQMLSTFLADFATLYGNERVDYNIHNLQHFEQIQQRLGSLKKLNGFIYEDQIKMINDFIDSSKTEGNLEEIGEKIIENSNNMVDNKINELIYTHYPYINQKHEIVFKNYVISSHEPDNHVYMRDGIIKIDNILISDFNKNNRVSFLGRRYEKIEIMFQAPLTNQRLLLVSSLSPTYTFYLSDIIGKAVKISHPKDGIFICPLIT
jgi:hypothetical protein